MPAPIDSMTLAQVQAEFVDLGHELSTVALRRQALLERMNKLRADAGAKAAVNRLSPEEREALREELNKG